MGRGVIVVYRPKKGKDEQLLQLLRVHVQILREQELATERHPIVMKAGDGSIIEVFEWKSEEAIQRAHENKIVQKLWEQFREVCDYEIPINVKEFHAMFSEFEVIVL
jgi:quinol monooxygenase YgiN